MKKLIDAIEPIRLHLLELNEDLSDSQLSKAADFIKILQAVLRGQDPIDAFGAPGDWGYHTPLGQAVLDAIRHHEDLEIKVGQKVTCAYTGVLGEVREIYSHGVRAMFLVKFEDEVDPKKCGATEVEIVE